MSHHEHHHDHEHGAGASSSERTQIGAWRRLIALIGHGHHHHDPSPPPTHAEGMRALWVSLVVLSVTAAAQLVIALASGSVALLADTVHNVSDALTAVPLAVAFWVGRRPPTARYTYG